MRAKKFSGATATIYIISGAKVITEYASGANVTSPTKEYIYVGSQLTATLSGGSTTYHHADHLSVRVNTSTTGSVVGTQGQFPFGESWYGSSTTTKFQFTSYERDSESGNDYAMTRSYVNRLARFSSPDTFAGRLRDPQSLNRYSYVRNDPVNLVDPLGLDFDLIIGNCIATFATYETDSGTDVVMVGMICGQDPSDRGPFEPPDFGGGGCPGCPTELPPMGPPPPPPPGYAQCIEEALLEVIAHGEGTDTDPNMGYGTLVRGTIIGAPAAFESVVGRRNLVFLNQEALPGFPHFLVNVTGDLNSSAFGRYQINYATAQDLHMTDMSRNGQDSAATTLMWRADMIAPAMAGNLQQAMQNGGRTWASLPGSPYGQPTMTMEEANRVFQEAMRTLPDCL